MSGHGTIVLGSGAAATAVILPNTSSNRVITVVAIFTSILGVMVLVTTVGRLIAKKASAHK
jgi:hypothetical protein